MRCSSVLRAKNCECSLLLDILCNPSLFLFCDVVICVIAVFELALKLPNLGKGQKVQRTTWKEGDYWTLTSVQPSPVRRAIS